MDESAQWICKVDLKVGDRVSPEQAMRLAIKEAWKGLGGVQTNPLVGCSIVSQDGRLLSLGYHSKFGEAHAEVHALNNLENKQALSGATVFVTLEPCSHEGKTPSCARRLSQWPIQKVVYGCRDPHPLARGGREILAQHGIHTELYESLEWELSELNEIFLHNVRQQQAFVCLKVATSLDGLLALRNGQSQWISGEASRERGHELRAKHDATLIGVNTYLQDKPRLNIRHPSYKGLKNKVIILDPQGKSVETLRASNLLKVHSPKDICLVVMNETVEKTMGLLTGEMSAIHIHGAKSLSTIDSMDIIDLKVLSQDLYEKFLISSVLVEGGSLTHSHFINQRAAQKMQQFIAPLILGGTSGVLWTQGVEVDAMAQRVEVQLYQVERLGPDILVTGYLQ